MRRQESFRDICIRDRNAAYAALGVSFWIVFTATLFAYQALSPQFAG